MIGYIIAIAVLIIFVAIPYFVIVIIEIVRQIKVYKKEKKELKLKNEELDQQIKTLF